MITGPVDIKYQWGGESTGLKAEVTLSRKDIATNTGLLSPLAGIWKITLNIDAEAIELNSTGGVKRKTDTATITGWATVTGEAMVIQLLEKGQIRFCYRLVVMDGELMKTGCGPEGWSDNLWER